MSESLTENGSNTISPVVIENIPEELQGADCFLRWTYSKKKNRKVPINKAGAYKGHADSDIHISFEEAKREAGGGKTGLGISLKNAGLSFYLEGLILYLWCFDCDGFIELGGDRCDDVLTEILDQVASYAEISPSKTGLKIFLLSEKKPESKRHIRFSPSEFAETHPGIKKYERREVEVFSKGFYLTLTGELWSSKDKQLRVIAEKELDELLAYIDDAAIKGGGKGAGKIPSPTVVQKRNDGSVQIYSKLTPESLELVLAYVDHCSESVWSDTANALARAYGEDGRQFFIGYSRGDYAGIEYQPFKLNEVESRYDRALRKTNDRPKPGGYGVKRLVEVAEHHSDWPSPRLEYEVASPFKDIANSGDLEKLESYSETGDSQRLQNQAKVINLSDLANGKRYANEFIDQIKFIRDTQKALIYDEAKGWVVGDSDQPIQAAKMIVQQMAEQAAEEFSARPTDESTKRLISEVRRTSKEPAIKSMISLARSEDGMSVGLGELDADDYLLGTLNGVINVKTNELLPAKPDLLVTKRINAHYDPDAVCHRYQKFLEEAIPDIEEREFLIRWNGYCLSGSAKEQKLLFLTGSGANGKTVYVENTKMILGDYADKIQTEMLMRQHRSSQAASPDLVGLQGRRFIYCNETAEGQRLDDARVKELTGGDTITGRAPFAREAISFSPTHKLVIAGNHPPVVTDDGDGMWRRMILFPFTQRFEGRDCDPDLLDKLWLEASGILNLWLKGFVEWNDGGLQVPASLARATNAYRDEQDLLLDWMNEKCEVAPDLKTEKLVLFAAYKAWCEDCSYHNLSKASFSRKLTGRGFKVTADKRKLIGIGLKNGVHIAQLR